MNTIVKAKADGLIWLIVGIFWVIAQIAGASKKKMPPQSLSNDREEGVPPPVDPFAELMRKLTGAQEFKIPEPPGPPLGEARFVTEEPKEFFEPEPPESKPAWSVGEIEKLPDMKPLHRDAPKPAPVVVDKLGKKIGGNIRPTMASFRNTLPAMKLPSMRLRFQCVAQDRNIDSGKVIGRAEQLELKNQKALRRAMLNHVILGKPRGLDHWSPGTVE